MSTILAIINMFPIKVFTIVFENYTVVDIN